MFGIACSLGLLSSFVASGSIEVTTRVAPGTHFVGEAVAVVVVAGGELGPGSLRFLAPACPNATIVEGASDQPGSRRFWVVPRRPGRLEIPPFRVELEGRAGVGKPTRLSVQNVPTAGRTSAFLGGVGRFEPSAGVEPASVVAGQPAEFWVRIEGPAAYGSGLAPSLERWGELARELEASTATVGDVETGSQPSRTFRFELRASREGKLTLPPLAIAAFEPSRKLFETRYTPSVTLEVTSPPRFDPARIRFGTSNTSARSSAWIAWLAVGGALVLGLAGWRIRRRRGARRVGPIERARRISSTFEVSEDPVAVARAISEGFARLIHGEAVGVLTPPEAFAMVERLTGGDSLASSVEGLLEVCDRIQFGGDAIAAGTLVPEARLLLERVAEELASAEGGRRRGRQSRPLLGRAGQSGPASH
jgi:hypothetical protein